MTQHDIAPVGREDEVYADLIHALVALSLERQKATPDLERAFALILRCEAFRRELKNLKTRLRSVPRDEIEHIIENRIDTALQPLENHLGDGAIAARAKREEARQIIKEKRINDVTRRDADEAVALLTTKVKNYVRESAKRSARIRRIEWLLNESTIEEHKAILREKLEANNDNG